MPADTCLPVWCARREAPPQGAPSGVESAAAAKQSARPPRHGNKTQRAMLGLKAALLVLLAGAVAISGSLSYTLGHNAEVRSLWRAFDAAVVATNSSFQKQLDLKVLAAQTGAQYLMLLPDPSAGGGTYEPGFQAIGESLLNITRSTSFIWLVVVADAQRVAFEAGALRAAQLQDPSGELAAQVAQDGIREFNASTGQFHPAARAPMYVVRWGTSPRDDPSLKLNHLQNIYNDPFRQQYLMRALNTGQPVLTPMLMGLIKDVTLNQHPPSSLVYYPVTLAGPTNGTGRAFCANGFHFADLLSQSVPESIESALIVLRDPNIVTRTFLWDGSEATDGGAGDLSSLLLPKRLQRRARSFVGHATGNDWRVTLYPTPALEHQFISDAPRNTALAVISASLACVLLFGIYELLVRRRAQMMNGVLRQHVTELQRMKRDVEDGCAREAQAQAAQLAEKAGIKIKEQFVAMVSHEIRTPLNAMSGAAALLAQTSPLNEEQRSLLALLDAAADNVTVIIDDILQASALSSGNFPVLREPLSLSRDVLEPAWRMIMLQPARRDKLERLRLSRHVNADVPEAIVGDAMRMLQVLTNLLSNSIKFTLEGGSIQLRVDVVAVPAGEIPGAAARWLRFRVIDTGIGIEPANLRKIFQPFVQAEASTVREYGGTGLGLTICQRIASAMEGTLIAESGGLNRGTTFTFAIPLVEQEAPATPDTAPPLLHAALRDTSYSDLGAASRAGPPPPPSPLLSASSNSPRPPLRVLVAEDDPLCAAVMRKILERLRVAGTIVGDGLAAVNAYKSADPPFHIVLLDLHMPLMDGLAACRAIVACERTTGRRPTPVVALTASCGEDEKQRCAEAGMVGHVAKPVKIEVLQALFLKYSCEEG